MTAEVVHLVQQDRIRVVHLSSIHHTFDTRIFWKECVSLARAGYDVTLVAPGDRGFTPERGEIVREGVKIVAVMRRSGRLRRMLTTSIEVVVNGLRCDGLIYHFHDPELIPFGLLLRVLGKRVIYDAHEDLPRAVLLKGWVPRRLRPLVSLAAGVVESLAAHALSGVVAATPVIARRFPRRRVALVQNFASLSELALVEKIPRGERRAVAYVGSVTAVRCAVEVVEAIAKVARFPEVPLIIAGPADRPLIEKLSTMQGWSRVEYRGLQDRDGIFRVLAESRVGLALYHPVQSYVDSQPVKLYEYMGAGLPVIAANFPGFRAVVDGNRCGLCVPPRDVAAIAAAIEWMFEHPAEAEEMGRRGRQAVLRFFNWDREEKELLGLYRRVAHGH